MSEYIDIGQDRTKLREYNETFVTNSYIDSFAQSSELSFANAKTIIKNIYSNDITNLIIYNMPVDEMIVAETIQLTALMYRGKQYSQILTPDVQGKDVTEASIWYTSNIGIVSVENGLVTAIGTGTATVYAKIGDFESNHITIVVS